MTYVSRHVHLALDAGRARDCHVKRVYMVSCPKSQTPLTSILTLNLKRLGTMTYIDINHIRLA